jgi:ParB family transcriptional regulator, chromosome partitioning protein
MAKNSVEAYGADGKTNLLTFDPEKIKLITDKAHKLYDPRVELALDDQLVASIMYRGVIKPVVVWKDPETGETCAVDGRRRIKAAREANKRLKKQGEPPKLISARVAAGNLQSAMGVMVVANEGHAPPTPMGRAKMAERLLENGYTEEQVAVLLHCAKPALKNYLALLQCTGAVRQAVESGRLSSSIAYKLSKAEPDEQKAALEKMLEAAGDEKGRNKRGKKMREATGVTKLRSRKEILAMREKHPEVAAILDWVLGGEEPKKASAKNGSPLDRRVEQEMDSP